MSESTPLSSALWYASDRGWPVFPAHYSNAGKCSCRNPQCDREAKHPLTPNGLNDATTDRDTIKGWFGKWPHANVAIATGQKTGLVVVDADGPNSAELLRRQRIFLPRTAATKTALGYHAYYAHPGKDVVVPNRVALLTDGLPKDKKSQIHIRGDGGYVIAPPSVHITGHVYQWTIQLTQPIAALPDDLLALIEKDHHDNIDQAFHQGED